MVENTVVIRNHSGLHARPASLLVNTAGKFQSNVRLVKNDKEVDLKSILGVMSLAVTSGETVTIKADGPDAEECIKQLTELIEQGLGETNE